MHAKGDPVPGKTPNPLRVWWIPQIPGKAFIVPVRSVREAWLLMNALADYDAFQFKERIKPDYCNAGGLSVLDPEDTEDGPEGSWVDFHPEEVDGCEGFEDDVARLTPEQADQIDRTLGYVTREGI